MLRFLKLVVLISTNVWQEFVPFLENLPIYQLSYLASVAAEPTSQSTVLLTVSRHFSSRKTPKPHCSASQKHAPRKLLLLSAGPAIFSSSFQACVILLLLLEPHPKQNYFTQKSQKKNSYTLLVRALFQALRSQQKQQQQKMFALGCILKYKTSRIS